MVVFRQTRAGDAKARHRDCRNLQFAAVAQGLGGSGPAPRVHRSRDREEEVRDFAHQQGLQDDQALQQGMAVKAVEFVKNGAEMPSFGVCGFGTWTLLAQDFVGQEQYVITPGSGFDNDPNGPQAAFRALMVAGVPIYPDPYCPEGTVYFLNTNYLSLYIHEQGSFVFTGFESTLPNWQIGYVGAVLMIAELVNVKPKSMTKVTGYNYLSL